MQGGQMQFEALAAFLVFLAVISSFLGILLGQAEAAEKAGSSLKAKMQAEKCATIVDALYSNAGIQSVNLDANCFSWEGNKVKARFGSAEKEAFAFAENISMARTGNETIIEVGVNDHYG